MVYKLVPPQPQFDTVTVEELNAIENFDGQFLGTDSVQDIKKGKEVATFLYVIDCDTIKVNINGKDISVRLIGIDTPEIHNPKVKKECYGDESKFALENLLTGQKEVLLKKDTIQPDKDIYNRFLRYVYLEDGTDINAYMIENGYAEVYTKSKSDREEEFLNLQEHATSKKLGLWSDCK